MRCGPIAALLVMAACGQDPGDLRGMYETTLLQTNGAGCGGVDRELDPPYFRMARHDDEETGDQYYQREDCTSDDEGSCDDGHGWLTERIDGGWQGEDPSAIGSGTSCTLVWVFRTAVIEQETLTYEAIEHSQQASGDDCTWEEASARAATMPCTGIERFVGERIE